MFVITIARRRIRGDDAMTTVDAARTRRPSGIATTIYLAPEQVAVLDEIEQRFGSSRSFLVRQALAYWLDSDEAKRLR
jgi:hypothetical protein